MSILEVMFMDLFEVFRIELEKVKTPKPYSEKTIISYCNDIKSLIRFTNKSIENITEEDVENFLNQDSPATSRRRYSSIVKFFEIMQYKNVPITKKTYGQLRQDPNRISERMTIPEGMRFLEEAKKNVKNFAMMMTFLNTGIREEELFTLDRSDYRIETNKDGELEGIIHIIGKGDKERYVPANNGVIEAVNTYLATRKDNDSMLFRSNFGNVYSPSALYTLVKRISKRAGINKNITPHKLRHTFATMMWENGADPVQIMYILGHSDIRTTMRYLGKLGLNKAKELTDRSAFNVK